MYEDDQMLSFFVLGSIHHVQSLQFQQRNLVGPLLYCYRVGESWVYQTEFSLDLAEMLGREQIVLRLGTGRKLIILLRC